MLVLTRKTRQQIQIGPNVTITILQIKGQAVRVGIEAPREVCVLRTELAEKLAVDDSGRAKDRFQRVVAKIGHEQTPIVVDEVQHALRDSAAVLEVLRDITDLTESVAVLVAGVENVQKKLERPQFKQIASRIFDRVEFAANSAEDTALACRELAEVELADDLVNEIHRQSAGLMRGIVNALSKVEAHAGRNKLARVGLADMAGKELIADWRSLRRAMGSHQ